jgi:hypothetical protein
MEQVLTWLKDVSSSPFMTIATFVLAIFSIVLAVFFYIRSRRNKEPVYTKKSFNIIQDFSSKLTDLAIIYKNESVTNLTITKIAFWNSGRETINMVDVAEADPLRISITNNSKILSAEVIYSGNPANKFRISEIKDNSVKLLFDYIDRNEGGIIQIIHTGKSSEDIDVKGIIKGAGKCVLRDLLPIPSFAFPLLAAPNLLLKSKHFGYFMFFSALLATILGIGLILFHEKEKSVGWVLTITYGIILPFIYFMFVRRRIPKEFDIIDEKF